MFCIKLTGPIVFAVRTIQIFSAALRMLPDIILYMLLSRLLWHSLAQCSAVALRVRDTVLST